jgi:perosamine synthetase
MQITELPYARNMYWVVGVLLADAIDSDILAAKLKARGVDTRPFFYPLHLQPLLKKYALGKQDVLPVTERLAKQGIYLPSFIGIANDDIDYVVEQLHASINEMV